MSDTGIVADPWHVPQGPTPEIPAHVRAVLARLVAPLCKALAEVVRDTSATVLLESEEACRRQAAVAVGHLVAGLLVWLHGDRAFVAHCVERAREGSARRLRHQGVRQTTVRFLGGARVRVETPYLTAVKGGAEGEEGADGQGHYPALECLGILAQASPALVGEVARQSVRCASFEEAAEALSQSGVTCDAKCVRHLTLAVGDEALRQRDLRLAAALEGRVPSREFAGQRVVVSADGGRLRMREPLPPAAGRRRFETPWCEPKLVVAYVIDDKGVKLRSERPLVDAPWLQRHARRRRRRLRHPRRRTPAARRRRGARDRRDRRRRAVDQFSPCAHAGSSISSSRLNVERRSERPNFGPSSVGHLI